jgi:hypothetical protein
MGMMGIERKPKTKAKTKTKRILPRIARMGTDRKKNKRGQPRKDAK